MRISEKKGHQNYFYPPPPPTKNKVLNFFRLILNQIKKLVPTKIAPEFRINKKKMTIKNGFGRKPSESLSSSVNTPLTQII